MLSPSTQPDAMGKNNTCTAFKGCNVKSSAYTEDECRSVRFILHLIHLQQTGSIDMSSEEINDILEYLYRITCRFVYPVTVEHSVLVISTYVIHIM